MGVTVEATRALEYGGGSGNSRRFESSPPPPTDRGTRRKDYKRDKDGKFNEVDEGRGSRQRRPMTAHEKHVAHVEHVRRVKGLQKLLNKLGLAKLAVDGKFGPETKKIVNKLQRKLGLPETGRVDGKLMRRLRDVEILSPCAKGAKRSQEMDELDELIRSVALDDPEDELEDDLEDDELDEGHARTLLTRCCPSEHTFAREWPLDGIEILRAGRGGDGRTVEAYAVPFGVSTEIKDQHGHYMETVDQTAFNEELARGIGGVGYYYHHGMTLHGTPSDLGSVPIGSPLEIRPDGRGLLTRTRLNKSALAESVLEAIRNGDLRGYSFRGAIKKSDPPRIARARDGYPLPTVTRMKLGLTEYGPTPTPYYADAKILAVRSIQQIVQDPEALLELQRELAYQLSRSTPLDQEPESATPDEEGPGAEDQPPGHSGRHQADIARKIARARILMGV